MIELDIKLLDEILRGGAGIRIIDLNDEYKKKIHHLSTATYRKSSSRARNYEAFDTAVLEKK